MNIGKQENIELQLRTLETDYSVLPLGSPYFLKCNLEIIISISSDLWENYMR